MTGPNTNTTLEEDFLKTRLMEEQRKENFEIAQKKQTMTLVSRHVIENVNAPTDPGHGRRLNYAFWG